MKSHNFCQQRTKVGTWNVITMAQTGNILKAIKEIKRLELKVLGINKIKWSDTNYCDIKEDKIYYSRVHKYEHSLGINIQKSIAQNVSNFVPANERIMIVQVKEIPVNVKIVQV